MNLEQLIEAAKENKASDLHIASNRPPMVRVMGSMVELEGFGVFSPELCERIACAVCEVSEIPKCGEIDTSCWVGSQRIRANVYRSQRHCSMAIRLLNSKIPELSTLGLPDSVGQLASLRSGMILVVGCTGSGKSTTLASILDKINHEYKKHIITLEDPVEYVYIPDQCVIDQREVGVDTDSYASGLYSSLREDPDVILIGEARDATTLGIALTSVETGHFVATTVHSKTAADSIERIVSEFPVDQQTQICLRLSMNLRAVISQQLLPKADESGKVLAYELMYVNSGIRSLIREGKFQQITNAIMTGSREGCVTFETSLAQLYKKKIITKDVALEYATDSDLLKRMLSA